MHACQVFFCLWVTKRVERVCFPPRMMAVTSSSHASRETICPLSSSPALSLFLLLPLTAFGKTRGGSTGHAHTVALSRENATTDRSLPPDSHTLTPHPLSLSLRGHSIAFTHFYLYSLPLFVRAFFGVRHYHSSGKASPRRRARPLSTQSVVKGVTGKREREKGGQVKEREKWR